MAFYKLENGTSFKIANYTQRVGEPKEVVDVWDNNAKQFLKEKDHSKFTGTSGVTYTWEQLKFLTATLKKTEFPNYGISVKWLYNVEINNQIGLLKLPVTAHKQIQAILEPIKDTPLVNNILFTVTSTGSGLGKKYEVKATKPTVNKPVIKMNLASPIDVSNPPLELIAVEKEIVKAITEAIKTGTQVTEDQFNNVCKDNGLQDDSRNKSVYRQYILTA